MQHEERMRWITKATVDYLRRFRQPDTDELSQMRIVKDIATAINKRCSASFAPDALAARVERCFERVTETYTAQQWPSTAHFVKAMDQTKPESKSEPTDLLGWARDLWWNKGKRCISPANTWEIAQALIAEGADPWEIRHAGFQTDTDYYRDLEATGRGWKGHEAKMAELRNGFMGAAE